MRIRTLALMIAVTLASLNIAGCLSAPQEQTQRSASGGDRIGSTPSTVINAAGNSTFNIFSTVDSHAPSTQPSHPEKTPATTITQTVSGAASASSSPGTAGDKGQSGSQSGGGQTSTPTNDVKPSTSIPINITPGAGGSLSLPGAK